MLGPDFNVEHFRNCIEGFQSGAPDGHPYWSFSNHDVPRQVTRWREHGVSDDSITRLACAMLMSFEGTIGIYQGEELGQTESELVFEELTDPPAIRYWPAVKGRDGCRTPMVWDNTLVNAGFSVSEPWLPVKAPQAANAVAQQTDDGILAYYKSMIALRKNSPALSRGTTSFVDVPDPLLAFMRKHDDQTLTCIFNLSKDIHSIPLIGKAEIKKGQAATFTGETLTLGGNGFAYLSHTGAVPI
jgi:alpha-glucosidase